MTERPLENIIRDGGMMNIFQTLGCIGDSLSSGEFEYIKDGGERGYWDYYEYSWGKQIERITGISVTNFSQGGLTAYEAYEIADVQNGTRCPNLNLLFDKNNLKQAYTMALGVNDRSQLELYSDGFGSACDICPDDYSKNKESFIGCYAKIIQRIQSMQPDTIFFLITIPRQSPDTDEKNREFAKAVSDVARVLPNCYVIDLFGEAPVYDDDFRAKYFCGHMNAMGYLLTAHYIMTYIDWIIRHNPKDFRFVPFIGKDYIPFVPSDKK